MAKQQNAKSPQGTSESPTGTPAAATSAADPGIMDQAKETVSNVAGQAGEKVTSRLDAQKGRIADGLSSITQALRQTGQQLREQNQASAATEYLNTATEQVERVANYIRSTDMRQMVSQVEQFARRQPVLFFGGAFALGLLGVRFLKSSSQTNPAYGGQTPRNESLVPVGNNDGTPGVSPGQTFQTQTTGQTSASVPTGPGTRRGGV